MRYLVDANVLSEPTKPAPDARVVHWLQKHESEFVVDPIVLGELSAGILALPAGKKRLRLEEWFSNMAGSIACVPWDAAVGLRWARLVVALKRKGTPIPILDSMIAATALEHGFVVATRNKRDFIAAGVEVVDPFS